MSPELFASIRHKGLLSNSAANELLMMFISDPVLFLTVTMNLSPAVTFIPGGLQYISKGFPDSVKPTLIKLAAFAQLYVAADAVDGMANAARASMVPPAISDDVVLNPKERKMMSPICRHQRPIGHIVG